MATGAQQGTPPQLLPAMRAALERLKREEEFAEKASKKFSAFVPLAWPSVEPARTFVPAWHIDAIADHLQACSDGHIQNLLVNVSPGSAKSVLTSVLFPAWMWVRNPKWRGTFASYEAGLSTRDSVRCRDLIKSDWYQRLFAPKWKFSTSQDEKTYYVNTEKGFRVSTSVGGRGTGWRSHGIVVDDPSKIDDQYSDAALDATERWWDNTMYNRLIDMKTGVRIIIMQRISDRDLSGHILRQGGWVHLCIPMEHDPSRSCVTTLAPGVEWRDPRTKRGELMCPEVFPQSVIDDLKTNPLRYAGQYDQNPTPGVGGLLQSHYWRYWQPKGMNLPAVRVKMPDGSIEERSAIELPDSFDIELQSWDLSLKDTKTSDFVVGQVHSVRGANRFIRDHSRGRMDLPATMSAIREMTGRNPHAHLKLVEDKANGPAVIQMLRDEIPGLVAVNPEGGKVSRAQAANVELQAGNWFLPHPLIAPWVGNPEKPLESGFIAETAKFPLGSNDDEVDAWSQGAKRIQTENIGGMFGVSEMDIRCDPFDLSLIEKWPRLYGFSVSWKEIAAVWLTRQPQTGQHYLYLEYSSGAMDPSQHAAAIKKIGDWPGFMAVADTGRDINSGYVIIKSYMSMGMRLESVRNSPEAGIIGFSEALRSNKLKVFGTLTQFFSQFRMFSRDDKGKLPEYNRGVIDAALVAWLCRDRMRTPPDPTVQKRREYSGPSGPQSWMAG